MLVGVATDTRSDDQVNNGDHLQPVLLLIAYVLCLHRGDELADKSADLLLKHSRQLCHKLHAHAPSCLSIRLFQIILDVLG